MTRLTDLPDRNRVREIIRDVARVRKVYVDELINGSRTPDVLQARYVAIRRILAETNCTQEGLAQVWGINVATVRQAVAEAGEKRAYRAAPPTPKTRPLYDERTIERLRWAHGDDRTTEIIAGQCPATQADIAAWRLIGGLA